ncbi:uncharacterized protein LOC120334257 [Styela clava]
MKILRTLLLQITGYFSICGVDSCNIPTDIADTVSGVIDTTKIMVRGRCRWKIPAISNPECLHVVYIPSYNFYNNITCTADIYINSDNRLLPCKSDEPVCHIFKRSISSINFAHLKQKIKPRRCAIWRIEETSLNTITFRKFSKFNGNEINITYQSIPPPYPTTNSATQTSTLNVANTKSTIRVSTFSKTTDIYKDDNNTEVTYSNERYCACTGYHIAVTLIILLLVATVVIFALFVYRKKDLFLTRHPRIRGSFFQAEAVDDEVESTDAKDIFDPTTIKKKPSRFSLSSKRRNVSVKKTPVENQRINGS